MASLFEDLQQRKQEREQYLANNPNPNRLQKPIDYSPEANRQKVANVAGSAGGLYTGSVGLGGDVEGVGKAYNNSAGVLDLVRMYVSKSLPIPEELKKQIAPNVAKPAFLAELNRIFEESDTFLTNSLDAREDLTNFFSDDGLGNSVLKNTPIGNNGIGDLLKEADEGAWLTGEILAPIPIPKFGKFVKNQAEDFINTGNNIGDKVVDNVVQTTKNVRDAGKSIYQTLEEGMSPELVTPDGQTVKVGDVDFDNQPLKSAEYMDESGNNPTTGNQVVDNQHLEDYNRGLEEALETEKITSGSDTLNPVQIEKVKNRFVEDFYDKNPNYVEEGVIRVDQDGNSVLRKADEVEAIELADKPLFKNNKRKGSQDTSELYNGETLGLQDKLDRTYSVDELINGSSLERLVGKDVLDKTQIRLVFPNILAGEKTGSRLTTRQIRERIMAEGTPEASFSNGTTGAGSRRGGYVDELNWEKSLFNWVEETGGVAKNADVMEELDQFFKSEMIKNPTTGKVVRNKAELDKLPALVRMKIMREAERLATVEGVNQWAMKNKNQLMKFDASNVEPLMATRQIKYDGKTLKEWVKELEADNLTNNVAKSLEDMLKNAYKETADDFVPINIDAQMRQIAEGVNPTTGQPFKSFKLDEKGFIHELEGHLNQRVNMGNRGGAQRSFLKDADIMPNEMKYFNRGLVRKYNYNKYRGLKGESEARNLERESGSTNKELAQSGRSGFDVYPKEVKVHEGTNGVTRTLEDPISNVVGAPIKNFGTKVVDGYGAETLVLRDIKRILKNPSEYKKLLGQVEERLNATKYDLNFDAPMPIQHIEAKIGEHLENTPKNPHPEVGDRFEVEFAGGLEAKKLADIEAMKNGSILPMIWDSSSANYYIRSVSGHTFKYPKEFMTHGGDDFSRVIKNQEQGIGGASNYDVVKMIRNRVDEVRKLNLEKGGSGDVFLMTRRMSPYRTGGNHPMDFSVQPTQLSLAILDNQPLAKADIARLDKSIRDMPVTKNKVTTYPFKSFKGVMSPKGRDQLFGIGKVGTSAGNLRKAFMNRMAIKQNQKAFHFNIEDVDMALTDPALRGVPYGYMGNAIIKAPDEGIKVVKGKNASYPYDFGGKYFGTMNHNFHMRTLYGKQYDEVLEELTKKNKDREKPKTIEAVHSQVVDALSKRKDLNQSSIYVDNDVYETLKGLQRPLEQSMDADVGLLQTESSAKTSINKSKMATPFKKIDWKEGEVNLDYGGGKFDNADEYLQTKGARNLVFDPFNRSAEHNAEIIKQTNKNPADTGTMTNVLNVIDSEASQIEALTNLSEGVKDGGKVYISVYEGSRTGKGKKTSSGYQQNKKTKDYLKTVQQVFPNAKLEKGMIVATN